MFTIRQLKNIAEDSGLTTGADGSADQVSFSKQERREIIRTGSSLEDQERCAAIEIQRIWRGYKARSIIFEVLNPNKSLSPNYGSKLPRNSSSISTFSNPKSRQSRTCSEINLSSKSSKVYKSYHSYKEMTSSQHDIPMECIFGNVQLNPLVNSLSRSFQEFCATIIKRWWKDAKLRKNQLKTPDSDGEFVESSLTSLDERIVEASRMAVSLTKTPSDQSMRGMNASEAASMIQKSWRRHIDMQVYKYYKELINFKCEGNPALMLRCINPLESSLLDSAAGVHVRFRLGGEQFPPNIYYKVFTSRNIADIGAFAPRDYTRADNKKLPMKQIHNKGIDLNQRNENDGGWYERWENNGWRPVSDKVLRHLYQDSVTYQTSKKTQKFHHSKLLRKADFEKRQKNKKIEWMKKMYREGALKAKEQNTNVTSLVESAAVGLTSSSQSRFHDSVEEWEVDELLEWTNGLNFEDYSKDWRELGTTIKTNITDGGKWNEFTKDPYAMSI